MLPQAHRGAMRAASRDFPAARRVMPVGGAITQAVIISVLTLGPRRATMAARRFCVRQPDRASTASAPVLAMGPQSAPRGGLIVQGGAITAGPLEVMIGG